jgi:hypothetical protein
LALSEAEPLGGQQDDRNGSTLADLAHDLDAVQVGHDDVQQDDVRPDLLGLGQRLFAAGGRHDAEAFVGEGHRHQLGDALLVVRDQDQGLSAHDLALLLPIQLRGGQGGHCRIPRPILCADSRRKARGNRRRRPGRPASGPDGGRRPRQPPTMRPPVGPRPHRRPIG